MYFVCIPLFLILQMLYNRINLFLTGVLVIILYFTIPLNNKWLHSKIIDNNILAHQMSTFDIETRKIERFGYSYKLYRNLAEKIKNPSVVLILMPPQAQLNRVNERNLTIVEPCLFYFYTGLKAVWADSRDAHLANYELMVNGPGQIDIKRIHDKGHLDSLITVYNQMLPK